MWASERPGGGLRATFLVSAATLLLCHQLFLGFPLCLEQSQAALWILNCNSNEAAQAYHVSACLLDGCLGEGFVNTASDFISHRAEI